MEKAGLDLESRIICKSDLGLGMDQGTARGADKYLRFKGFYHLLAAITITFCLVLSHVVWNPFEFGSNRTISSFDETSRYTCQQVAPLSPVNHPNVSQFLEKRLADEAYLHASRGYLSGLVQIPSESFDDFGEVGQDPRWDKFFKIEKYLKDTFPLVFDNFELTHVNTHGLVLTWHGSDAASRPILLTAHQDVVPVLPDTISQWKYDPFGGYDDGEKIWGRGSSDDKGYLISLMESVNLLIEGGFKPTRTVILAFGFDEEISGLRGAQTISKHLLEKYGPDSVYLLIDEGSALSRLYDISVATPGVGEKGYIDIGLTVTAAGGHASLPPDHTSIGILSEILVHLEANAFTPKLTSENPMYNFFECLNAHGKNFPEEISQWLPGVAVGDVSSELEIADILSKQGRAIKYLLTTSQAIDKVSGGIKINALPEQARADLNIRIAVESSIEEVKQHYVELLKPFADKYDLEYFPFTQGADDSNSKYKLILSVEDSPLNPAPLSPLDSEQYRILSGTIRSTLSNRLDKDVIVAPGIMSGNTDTRYYWALTENIYRFNPAVWDSRMNNVHTVDEFSLVKDRPFSVKFFADLILNADEAA